MVLYVGSVQVVFICQQIEIEKFCIVIVYNDVIKGNYVLMDFVVQIDVVIQIMKIVNGIEVFVEFVKFCICVGL